MNSSSGGNPVHIASLMHSEGGAVTLAVPNCDALSLSPTEAVQVAEQLLEAAASVEGQVAWPR